MKGVVLATGMTLLFMVVMTAIFRRWRIERRAVAMSRLYLASLPVFLGAYLVTPADLGFLPGYLTETRAVLDLGFGLLLWTAAFFGGILQLYNLADRGFSLRIVMDIESSKNRALSLDEVLRGYSAGRGIAWMYQKRLDNLVSQRLSRVENGWICNQARGQRLALVFAWLRMFLRMDSK
ncbi:hypothetical protein AYO40_05650 [Planctomycetaceae bacterium SCGC AG-212-D15]|nr:hypothetical protein AYO40_05650 [Planctomycetaceae bacterium SCGC AG-212-D15]